MPGQGRRGRANSSHGPKSVQRIGCWIVLCIVSAGFLFLPAGSICAQSIDWRMPNNWTQDSEPTDLCFVDRDNGWVVGDRGLVLRTTDGGRNWRTVRLMVDPNDRESMQVSCRLESVFFASATHGWIAGGYTQPRSTSSTGVLYATTDGGNTWKPLNGAALPKINQLLFTSPLDGIAIGDGNVLKPSGVYQTNDGGRSWSSTVNGEIEKWHTGSHVDGVVVMAADSGKLGQYTNHQVAPSYITEARPNIIRKMHMMDQRFGYAIGDQGNILQTRNAGLSWSPIKENSGLPGASFDARALAFQGPAVWIGGNPGTHIYQLNPQQGRWRSIATGIQSPLADLQFVDEQFGWGVSIGGDVIHTSDGGQTWKMQRRGVRGVAILQVSDKPASLNPELFAKFCADEDYIGGCLVLQDSSSAVIDLEPIRQAMSRVGGAFLIDRRFDFAHQESAEHQMLEFLVRQIRSFQPRVIAIPSGRVVNESLSVRSLVMKAAKMAASPDFFCSSIQPVQIIDLASRKSGRDGSWGCGLAPNLDGSLHDECRGRC